VETPLKAYFAQGIVMDEEKAVPVLNSFYCRAPFWFVLETFFWPNFRAGALAGGGPDRRSRNKKRPAPARRRYFK